MAEITFRWSGILLILGATLLGAAIVVVSFTPVVNRPLSSHISLLLLLSAALLLLSLPAVYVKQAQAGGWVGLAGHALLQTGILLLVVLATTPLLYPSLNLAPGKNLTVLLLGIALTLGLLLTAIATIQADVFPRWAGVMLLAATAGFFFVFFVAEFLPPEAGQIGAAFFGILLALALVWIGIAIWMGKPTPTT
ncbi:MAG: hypothetical protein U0768_04265 [Anaerolineae bacterium]